jgi:hypothetical protein
MYTIQLFLLIRVLLLVSAWTPYYYPARATNMWIRSTTTTTTRVATPATPLSNSAIALQEEEDEEDEWEYLEYEDLQESDFVGSEWLVGTNYDSAANKIEETWVRCLVDSEKSKQPCIWGDGNKGTWYFDRASQYFSLSKEYVWGKTIWAGVVEDYYFLQGTVRGWTYLTPARVVGQWQAKRLGVDPEEAGIAPWFMEQEEETTKRNETETNEEETKEEEGE